MAISGQPPIRLRDLRHGAATLAPAAHPDLKVVQAMLGHVRHRADRPTAPRIMLIQNHVRSPDRRGRQVIRRQQDLNQGSEDLDSRWTATGDWDHEQVTCPQGQTPAPPGHPAGRKTTR
ncbi:hypothetical protein ACFYUK_25670 [Nonomuraea wenchangensis]